MSQQMDEEKLHKGMCKNNGSDFSHAHTFQKIQDGMAAIVHFVLPMNTHTRSFEHKERKKKSILILTLRYRFMSINFW